MVETVLNKIMYMHTVASRAAFSLQPYYLLYTTAYL